MHPRLAVRDSQEAVFRWSPPLLLLLLLLLIFMVVSTKSDQTILLTSRRSLASTRGRRIDSSLHSRPCINSWYYSFATCVSTKSQPLALVCTPKQNSLTCASAACVIPYYPTLLDTLRLRYLFLPEELEEAHRNNQLASQTCPEVWTGGTWHHAL